MAYDPNDSYTLTGVVELYDRSGTRLTVSAAHEAGILSANAHGLAAGESVFVGASGALPAGLSATTEYFVRDVTGGGFKLATARDGAAVAFTDEGTGVWVRRGFVDLGEVTKFSWTPDVSTKEMNTSRSRERGTVKTIIDKVGAKVELEFATVSLTNLQLVFGGDRANAGHPRRISLLQKPIREVYLRCTGTTDAGDFGVFHAPRVSIKPGKAVDLLSDDWWKSGVEGSVLKDVAYPGDEYGWFDPAEELTQ